VRGTSATAVLLLTPVESAAQPSKDVSRISASCCSSNPMCAVPCEQAQLNKYLPYS